MRIIVITRRNNDLQCPNCIYRGNYVKKADTHRNLLESIGIFGLVSEIYSHSMTICQDNLQFCKSFFCIGKIRLDKSAFVVVAWYLLGEIVLINQQLSPGHIK